MIRITLKKCCHSCKLFDMQVAQDDEMYIGGLVKKDTAISCEYLHLCKHAAACEESTNIVLD